jgi:hypothetical protein
VQATCAAASASVAARYFHHHYRDHPRHGQLEPVR